MTISIAKVTTETDNELYLLRKYSPGKELQLHILNVKDRRAYFGNVGDLELRTMAAELRMEFRHYVVETSKAFLHSDDNSEYKYALEDDDDDQNPLFKWKKFVVNDGVTLTLGEIHIEKREFSHVLSEMLSMTSSQIAAIADDNRKLSSEIDTTRQDLENTHDLLREALTAKEDLEKEFYTKFVMILNSKKQKIAELHREIESLENYNRPIGRGEVMTNQQRGRVKSGLLPVPGPSDVGRKSHRTSLLFDDEEQDEAPPPKLNRKRVRQNAKKKSNNRQSPESNHSNSDEDVDNLLDRI